MREKNALRNLLTMMMMVMLCVGFAACGDDDDDKGYSGIVGTWKNGNKTMELSSNGDYYTYYGSNRTGSESQYRRGSYSYNANQKLMTISVVAVPNHNGAYQDVFIVQTLTETTLVLVEMDGSVEGYYTRVK